MSDTFEKRSKLGDLAETVLGEILKSKNVLHELYAKRVRPLFEELDPTYAAALRHESSRTDPFFRCERYAPDFRLGQCVKTMQGPELFIEVKAMFSPRYLAGARQGEFQNLPATDIGDVERDALNVYLEDYSPGCGKPYRTALFVACNYHPRRFLCEFVHKLEILAVADGGRNERSGGSGTPHANINLAKMRTFEEFARDELGIELANDADWTMAQHQMASMMGYLTAPSSLQDGGSQQREVEAVAADLSKQMGRNLKLIWTGKPRAATDDGLTVRDDQMLIKIPIAANDKLKSAFRGAGLRWNGAEKAWVAPNNAVSQTCWKSFQAVR